MMRFLPIGHLSLLFFAFALALSAGGAPVFGDPDTAWHIAAGDLIRHLHWPPLYDSWSFTADDERWYNLSWLFDAGLSWLFAQCGFSALYVLTIAVFTGCLMAMLHYCIQKGANIHAVFGLSLLALLIMYSSILARPNMASALLTVVFYQLLQAYRVKGNIKTLFWLPLLMALWVNLHGGFILAFALMGIFWVAALMGGDRQHARIYGFTIAACLAATLINPYGFELYYGAWRTIGGHFDKNFIYEWRAAKVGADLPLTLLLLTMLCTGNFTDRRIALVDRVLAVMMMMLSLATIRHGIIAVLLILPYLSQRLSIMLYDSRWGHRLLAQHKKILQDMQQNDIRIMGAMLVCAAMISLCVPAIRDVIVEEPAGFPQADFPVEEAAFILEHYPHLRFYNDYNIGGYLDFLWRGRVKVFIDGRASSVYSAELLNDYFESVSSRGFGPHMSMIVSQYHLDGVIIPNDSENAADWLWNPAWRMVFRGPVATVYLKSDSGDKVALSQGGTAHTLHHESLPLRIKKALKW